MCLLLSTRLGRKSGSGRLLGTSTCAQAPGERGLEGATQFGNDKEPCVYMRSVVACDVSSPRRNVKIRVSVVF